MSPEKMHDMKPLFVDLEGTLVATDTLWESVLIFLRNNPLRIIRLLQWTLKGKKYFKEQIARRVSLNVASLPYRSEVVEFIEKEHSSGRTVVLATDSHRLVAEKIAEHLGVFSDILVTDPNGNLSGENKLRAIEAYTHGNSFDYLGNAMVDLPVWQVAAQAICAGGSKKTQKRVENLANGRFIKSGENHYFLFTLLKAMRVHQWSKNLLLFIPAFMAHRIFDFHIIVQLLFAFFAFSLCASAVYILNDLLDLEADRLHPTKKDRPFAAGFLSIPRGLTIGVLLMFGGFTLGYYFLPINFPRIMVLYLILTTVYSFFLKRKAIIDVITLAGLYALRIFAGALAVKVPVSSWLLAFSLFFFLSLALMKRFSDLQLLRDNLNEQIAGRGYLATDFGIVQASGIASGYLSLLVLALYINSNHVKNLYSQPQLLWLMIPFLLYWITRMWLLTNRGEMTDDPIVFTMKDWVSILISLIVLFILLLASVLDKIYHLQSIRMIQ